MNDRIRSIQSAMHLARKQAHRESITCSFTAEVDHLFRPFVKIRLQNNGTISLDRQWAVLVTIQKAELESWSSSSSSSSFSSSSSLLPPLTGGHLAMMTASFPLLQHFRPGAEWEQRIELDERLDGYSTLDVSSFLCFSDAVDAENGMSG